MSLFRPLGYLIKPRPFSVEIGIWQCILGECTCRHLFRNHGLHCIALGRKVPISLNQPKLRSKATKKEQIEANECIVS